jgi:hypothetical protein
LLMGKGTARILIAILLGTALALICVYLTEPYCTAEVLSKESKVSLQATCFDHTFHCLHIRLDLIF